MQEITSRPKPPFRMEEDVHTVSYVLISFMGFNTMAFPEEQVQCNQMAGTLLTSYVCPLLHLDLDFFEINISGGVLFYFI